VKRLVSAVTKYPQNILETSSQFWTDFDLDLLTRKKFVDLNRLQFNNEISHVITFGHWSQTYFHKEEFKSHRHENIQLLKSCKSRRLNLFYHTLLHSQAALNARKQGELQKYHHQLLNTSLSIEECVMDYECLKNSNLSIITDPFNPSELYHLCGSHCMQRFEQKRATGSYYNLYNHRTFTVVGTVETFDYFLDMLECAYPNRMMNIGKHFNHVCMYLFSILSLMSHACHRKTIIHFVWRAGAKIRQD
jgi:hypothetical protein